MSGNNWLGKQLDSAEREVQSWGEWKRDTMRLEATSIASEGITVAPIPGNYPFDIPAEVSQHAHGWLFGLQQRGFIKEYLSGHKGVAFRRTEPPGGKPVQDGFVFKSAMIGKRSRIDNIQLRSLNGGFHQQQPFMFPYNVKVMQSVEKRVPSEVSFCSFDRGDFRGSDPLFCFQSIYGAQKISGILTDGEVSLAVRFCAIARQECRHQDIETGPDRVDDCSDVSDDKRIDRLAQIRSEQFPFAVIRVWLHDQFVWCAPLPGYESLLKHWDMGVGPVNGVP